MPKPGELGLELVSGYNAGKSAWLHRPRQIAAYGDDVLVHGVKQRNPGQWPTQYAIAMSSESGTSLAAPQAVGALAMMRAATPCLSNDALIGLLLRSASRRAYSADRSFKVPVLDARAAVDRMIRTCGPNNQACCDLI